MISLLQWLLRGPRFLKVARIAVFVVAILAMLYVAAMCAWFGWSEWSFQHFQAQSLFNGSVGALANAGISSIAFAAIACYQFRRCHPEDRLLLAVLALGLVCLSFFANVSFAFGWDVECYGLYLAILGGATTCLGALGELLAAAKVRRCAADAVDDAPRSLTDPWTPLPFQSCQSADCRFFNPKSEFRNPKFLQFARHGQFAHEGQGVVDERLRHVVVGGGDEFIGQVLGHAGHVAQFRAEALDGVLVPAGPPHRDRAAGLSGQRVLDRGSADQGCASAWSTGEA